MYKQQHITNSVEHKLQFEHCTLLCSATVIEAIHRIIQRRLQNFKSSPSTF